MPIAGVINVSLGASNCQPASPGVQGDIDGQEWPDGALSQRTCCITSQEAGLKVLTKRRIEVDNKCSKRHLN